MSKETIRAKLLIIGSGPAGYTAAIYAARANLSPILISGYDQGGQLMTTTEVENYPGFAEAIQGPWLMEQMKKQAEHVGVKIIMDMIEKVDFDGAEPEGLEDPKDRKLEGDDGSEKRKVFRLFGESGVMYESEAVIIATGAQAKYLGLESEMKYRGFGVSGCATCDGFFYKNKTVAVIGGGNTAVEEALYLATLAKKVYVVHRRDSFKAEKILQDRLFVNQKIEVIWNNQLDEVIGEDVGGNKSVTGMRLKNTSDSSTKEIPLDGIFIAIGHKPSTQFLQNSGIKMDSEGYIIVKAGTVETNIAGVFAAGDVADKHYRQAVTAAGLGCMAALDAQRFLEQ